MFHFDNYALTMRLLPRKLVRQSSGFEDMLDTRIKNKKNKDLLLLKEQFELP